MYATGEPVLSITWISMLRDFLPTLSSLGDQEVESDSRGNIIHSLIEAIRRSLPKTFGLENAVRFKQIRIGKIFNSVIKKLEGIKDGKSQRTRYTTGSSIPRTSAYHNLGLGYLSSVFAKARSRRTLPGPSLLDLCLSAAFWNLRATSLADT